MSPLPKGAGAVRCGDCGAEARADGKGTPIVLHHEPDCPSSNPGILGVPNVEFEKAKPSDDAIATVIESALRELEIYISDEDVDTIVNALREKYSITERS